LTKAATYDDIGINTSNFDMFSDILLFPAITPEGENKGNRSGLRLFGSST